MVSNCYAVSLIIYLGFMQHDVYIVDLNRKLGMIKNTFSELGVVAMSDCSLSCTAHVVTLFYVPTHQWRSWGGVWGGAQTILGGSGGMLPRKIFKFKVAKNPPIFNS